MSKVKKPSKTLMIVERDQERWNRLGGGSGATTFYSLHYTEHASINRNVHGYHKMVYSACDVSAKVRRMEQTANGAEGNMWTVDPND